MCCCILEHHQRMPDATILQSECWTGPMCRQEPQEGSLWKSIMFSVSHASLRVLIPARRKEANEDIPGGQRPPQRHLYSEQGLTAYPKLVEIGAPLPIQGHIRPLHSVHFPAFLPLEDLRSCDVFVKTLRIK